MPLCPPLLLLHGALASSAQFDVLVAHLAPEFTVIAPDFSGHGQQLDADAPFAMSSFVSQAVSALDHAGAQTASVFGYSMGGYVGLVMARRHPVRVARLMTLGTMLRWSPEIAAREAARLDPATIAAKVPAFANLLAERHGPRWASVVERTATMMADLGEAPLLGVDDLRAIEQPVRIAVGDRDEVVTLAECAEARAALPRGELEVLPATGHSFERVSVPRLAASLREFLAADGA